MKANSIQRIMAEMPMLEYEVLRVKWGLNPSQIPRSVEECAALFLVTPDELREIETRAMAMARVKAKRIMK